MARTVPLLKHSQLNDIHRDSDQLKQVQTTFDETCS